MTKTNEAFWWSLFSAGGMIAAFAAPVMILLTGFVAPLSGSEALAYDQARDLLSNVVVKVALAGVVSLSLFHCVHRIRHTLQDVGVGGGSSLAALCYGAAAAGSLWCGVLLAGL